MKTTNKKFQLKKKEQMYLKRFVKTGQHNAKEIERGYVLLALHNGKKQKEISEFYMVGRKSTWRLKNKYEKQGLENALKDDPRSGQPAKYKEKEESEIVALACTNVPEGRARWTLELLQKKLQMIDGMNSINRETIRLTLKKRNVSLG